MPPRPLPNPETEPLAIAPPRRSRRPAPPAPARELGDAAATTVAPRILPPSTLLLCGWLGLQLAVLAVAWFHVPLAANYPPGERLGVEPLLVLMLAVGSLLSPAWVRRPATFLLALASTWPALLLAGAMATRPVGATSLAAGGVNLWLLTVFVWTALFRSESLRSVVSSAGALVAIVSGIGWYLALEFGPTGGSEVTELGWKVLPVPLAIGAATGSTSLADALPIVALLAVGGMLLGARDAVRRSRRRLEVTVQP